MCQFWLVPKTKGSESLFAVQGCSLSETVSGPFARHAQKGAERALAASRVLCQDLKKKKRTARDDGKTSGPYRAIVRWRHGGGTVGKRRSGMEAMTALGTQRKERSVARYDAPASS